MLGGAPSAEGFNFSSCVLLAHAARVVDPRGMSRRLLRTVAIVAAVAAPCAGFAACGLDEGGILPVDGATLDVVGGDVINLPDTGPDVVVDNYVPPACADLDASCLGAAIPDGWVPLGLTTNNALATPCPGDAEDFDQVDWATNPRLHAGACACGTCTTSGAWACVGQVTVATGNNDCSTVKDTFDASPHCTTNVASGGQSQVAGSLPTVGGAVTCDASVIGNGQVDTTAVRTCRPLQCTTDYCGLKPQGFQLCILYNGDTGGQCPPGFSLGIANNNTTPGRIDSPQNTASSCNACACTVSSPGSTCTATLRTFSSGDCDGDGGTGGSGYMSSYPAAGLASCSQVNSSALSSVFYQPGRPPDAGCATTTLGGSGTAGLKAPATVCCVP
jgi:hypothetical protein